jgi:hypothetical protein
MLARKETTMAETIVPRPPDRDATPATPTGMPESLRATSPEAPATGTYVGQSAAHGDRDVLESAKEQGLHVAAETGHQVRDLYYRAVGEVNDQAGVQQKRVVNGLYALSDEAARMAGAVGPSGAMTPLVEQAGHRFRQAGEWLERREPGDVLREVREFARQHPGTFLVGAAFLGVLAGRLTTNLAGGSADSQGSAPFPAGPNSVTAAVSSADRPTGTTGEWDSR